MSLDDVQTLYAYDRWANRRFLEASRRLEPRDLARDLGASHGSVKGTLVHVLWGEWLWLRRWRGESPKQVFDPDQFTDLVELESSWNAVEREQSAFIACLTEEHLARRVAYENLQGQRWEYSLAQTMQHLVNHSSYHRGQLAALMRQLGHAPPATDYLVFFDEADHGPDSATRPASARVRSLPRDAGRRP